MRKTLFYKKMLLVLLILILSSSIFSGCNFNIFGSPEYEITAYSFYNGEVDVTNRFGETGIGNEYYIIGGSKTTLNKGDSKTFGAIARDGFKFTGWYEHDGDSHILISYDETLILNYRKGMATKYYAHFANDGGYDGPIFNVFFGSGGYWVNLNETMAETYPDNLPQDQIEDNKAFLGWNLTGEVDGNYTDFNEPITCDCVYLPVFTDISDPVTLKIGAITGTGLSAQGGSVSFLFIENKTLVTVQRGDQRVVNASEQSGYRFIGWYDSEDYTNLISQEESYRFNVEENTELYARFVLQNDESYIKQITTYDYTNMELSDLGGGVTYIHNGEYTTYLDEIGTYQLVRGDKATLQAYCTTGYKFDGWYNLNDLETKISIELELHIVALEDVTYVANFVRI